jgi:hypothetical protein
MGLSFPISGCAVAPIICYMSLHLPVSSLNHYAWQNLDVFTVIFIALQQGKCPMSHPKLRLNFTRHRDIKLLGDGQSTPTCATVKWDLSMISSAANPTWPQRPPSWIWFPSIRGQTPWVDWSDFLWLIGGWLEEGYFRWTAPPLIKDGHDGRHLGFGFRRLSDERLGRLVRFVCELLWLIGGMFCFTISTASYSRWPLQHPSWIWLSVDYLRYPGEIIPKQRMFNYWMKLLNGKHSKLCVNYIYKIIFHIQSIDRFTSPWLFHIQKILQYCGLNRVWLSVCSKFQVFIQPGQTNSERPICARLACKGIVGEPANI